MKTNVPNELLSLGKICSIVQRSPREIIVAADALGIQPELVLNEIRYFSESQLHDLRAVLTPVSEPLL